MSKKEKMALAHHQSQYGEITPRPAKSFGRQPSKISHWLDLERRPGPIVCVGRRVYSSAPEMQLNTRHYMGRCVSYETRCARIVQRDGPEQTASPSLNILRKLDSAGRPPAD